MLISPGTNYPDLFGVISPQRLSLDVADVAFGLRAIPRVPVLLDDPIEVVEVSAGQRFEGILLVQNNADCDIDVEAHLIVPAKDNKGATRRFITKADKKIVVGLIAGEVGYIRFPVTLDPQTAVYDQYLLQIEVEIKRKVRTAARVRSANGIPVKVADLPHQVRSSLTILSEVSFTGVPNRQGRNAALLIQTFAVIPLIRGAAVLSGNTAELTKVDWISIWTPRNMVDNQLSERSRSLTTMAQTQLRRENVFIPLVRATQTHFEQAGYRLWAGEAVVIAKLMTLLLEGSATTTAAIRAVEDQPRWFIQMATLLLDSPDMVKSVGKMAAEPLYLDLVYDAALTAFSLLSSVTTEDLGTPVEKAEYAESLVEMLKGSHAGGEAIDMVHAYLPLILGGLTINNELLMAGEQGLDSMELIVNARAARERERTESTQFVFDLLDKVLDQGLAEHDTSLQRYLDPIERLRYKSP